MAETPVATEESIWLVVLILIALAVGAVFMFLNPQLQSVTFRFLCNSFYDMMYFFIGPRPPIELCGPENAQIPGAK